VERRQVFDLPRRRLEVTEHRAASCRCQCGTTTKAAFPAPARATTCYGPAVRALGCYLIARQHLPVARAAELLADALGAPAFGCGMLLNGAAVDVLRTPLPEHVVMHERLVLPRRVGAGEVVYDPAPSVRYR
jgi:transposase